MNNLRDPELEPPSAEILNEKDRALNLLSQKFEAIARELGANSFRLIRVADSEIPEEHAEVRTDILYQVREQVATLNQLILEIEREEKIIDITPDRKLLGKE